MNIQGYLVFHLNLAFSSIEVNQRNDVIDLCYWPLLNLIKETSIPIGIELTGSTLIELEKLAPDWVAEFKALLSAKRCELIGSGYSQIIAPLVPYEVNRWNQKYGIQIYEEILGVRPDIVLVNEMAYSYSLVKLYIDAGYKGLIMDRDNVRLALGIENSARKSVPKFAHDDEGLELPVLWADSMLFQKFQHYVHGDIKLSDYSKYLQRRVQKGTSIFPIYTNDAEVFDFRPGRYSHETKVHTDSEWGRIQKLLVVLSDEFNMHWLSPSDALLKMLDGENNSGSRLTSIFKPVPVKKQAKYNLSRWAVTGRNDLWLNTMCHRIFKSYQTNNNQNDNDWRDLCELWSSDLRTHITDLRWSQSIDQLKKCLHRLELKDTFESCDTREYNYHAMPENMVIKNGYIKHDEDRILVTINLPETRLKLNVRRGLTIESLAFKSHDFKPCIGRLPLGRFDNIRYGADYYSGGVVVEIPALRLKITDLHPVNPLFATDESGNVIVTADIETTQGIIRKKIVISSSEESISMSYSFPGWHRPVGSIRVGNVSLLPGFWEGKLKLFCNNGGASLESFRIDRAVEHGAQASSFVSASAGLSATTGLVRLVGQKGAVDFTWDTSQCSVLPMLQNYELESGRLTRLFFSMLEYDETSREAGLMGALEFSLSSSSVS